MKKVTIREVAITDLSMRFARDMGNKTIRHYKVSSAKVILGKETGVTALDMVKEKIKEEEGEVEVEFIPLSYDTRLGHRHGAGGMAPVVDLSNELLKNDLDIKKSLEQIQRLSTLHQYDICEHPLKTRFLSPLTKLINRLVIEKINRLLYKAHYTNDMFSEKPENVTDSMAKKIALREMIAKIPRLRRLPEWGFVRCVTPCVFLTVGFEEEDYEGATKSILEDLRILQSHGLIMGHLAMPSAIVLADTVGNGMHKYAVFCFLFLDYIKLGKILNKAPLEMPKKPLELLGVKNECFEGSVNYYNNIPPESKYTIEEVEAGPKVDKEKAVLDSYQALKEALVVMENLRKKAEK